MQMYEQVLGLEAAVKSAEAGELVHTNDLRRELLTATLRIVIVCCKVLLFVHSSHKFPVRWQKLLTRGAAGLNSEVEFCVPLAFQTA